MKQISPRERFFSSYAPAYVYLAIMPTLLTISAIVRKEVVESVTWFVLSITLYAMAIHACATYNEEQ
jgi:hypothetical protein